MNEEYILQKVQKHLVNGDHLSHASFERLFEHIDEDQQHQIREILERNSIIIAEYKQGPSDKCPKRRNLIRLSNEYLCILYQRGEQDALDALCRKNQGFVYSVASSFKASYRHKLTIDDLVNLGFMGFIESVKKFDTTSSYKLISYAVHYVRKAIMAGIAKYGFTVRLPLNILDGIRCIVKLQAVKPNISINEIMDYFDKKEFTENKAHTLIQVFNATLHPTSLHEPINDADGNCLLDLLVNDDQSPEEMLICTETKAFIHKLIEGLNDRGKSIIEYRYGLNGCEEKTLEQIGELIGLTRERVRQICEKMIEKLSLNFKRSQSEYEFGG